MDILYLGGEPLTSRDSGSAITLSDSGITSTLR